MKPTWNNATQQPSEFIRQFQNWRDEIYNYESTVRSEIAPSMKMALLLQHIQGDIKSYVQLNTDMANPNFENATMKVEDYYRSVYIDNNYSTRVSGLRGKYGKGKDKGRKGKGDYNSPKGKGYTSNYPSYQRGKGKGKYKS
eukprot:1836725-Amphidinium_carterae.2